MHVENFIHKLLNENNNTSNPKDWEEKIWTLMQQVGDVADWGLKRTKSDDLAMESGQWKFTFRIEPKGAKLKSVIENMPASYADTPTSRSHLLKLVTGRIPISDKKTRSHLDKAQKVFYRAQRPLIKALEQKLSVLDPIFNPTGFAYSGKGDTLWEMWIDDMDIQKFDPSYYEKHFLGIDPIPGSVDDPATAGSKPGVDPKPKPKKASSTAQDPVPVPKPEPKPKPPKPRKPKHILPRKQLDGLVDTMIKDLGVSVDFIQEGSDAIADYYDVVELSWEEDSDWLVVSDSYNNSKNPAILDEPPNVVQLVATTPRKVSSRAEWISLNQGRQPYHVRPKEEDLMTMQGRKYKAGKSAGRGQYKFVKKAKTGKTAGKAHRTARTNPTTNPSRSETPENLRDRIEMSKKSRYGGPEAKQIKRMQNSTRTYDEIAVYANVIPAVNVFTKKARKYGGEVIYYFFKIVPKE